MARNFQKRQRQWRKPYILPDVQAFHLEQLRRFLRFVNSEYESTLSFRGDILTLMYDEPIEEIRKKYPHAERAVLPGWGLGECLKLQERLRGEFGRMVQATSRPGGYRIEMRVRVFETSDWAEGDEAFRLSPLRGFPADEDGLVRLILGTVAGYMDGLKRDCVPKCQRTDCGRYFLDPALRAARHCSQACRYLAYEERRKRPRPKKAQKKG